MSMSPKTRARTATARPYSSANTRSISESVTAGMSSSAIGVASERPHFDRKWDDPRRFPGPLQRRVEIGRLDDGETAQMFFALDVRAVRRQHVIALKPKHRGRARGVQAS